jgi:CheY-like chemotaxis protein
MTMESPRILVAIANPALRAQVRAVVQAAGCASSESVDGRGTLAALRRERFALVLLGLTFPDTDGFALIDRIRALPHGPELSVVALAECRCPACQRLLVHRDFTDFAFTPLDDARLRATIALYLPLDSTREG